jgi:hypothetical protein
MITGKKIENMLEEAWERFLNYYNEKAPEYRENWRPMLNEKQAKDSHWICWNENDLTFYIGRFFYEILRDQEKEFSNIEIHFEKNVNLTNFKGYMFEGRLDELKKNLKMKRGPKVDMIVAYEDRNDSFLLCAEVKYFHSAVRYNTTPNDLINADIKKLKAIRDFGIAKRVVFILFDDYYWCNDGETANAIQQRLNEIRQDGITVLFHTSEAKLREI